MAKKLLNILFCSIVLLCMSCSKEQGQNVQFIPFQESDNSLWGMISPSGNVLFNEEFKEKPTVVRDNRFMVRNADGLWEIYTADEKPQKIGSEYAFASMFKDGKALVSEKGKCVSLIDTDGKTIKVLDKVDGKVVDGVEPYSEGYAIFKSDKYFGVIDENGNKVINPDYLRMYSCSDGKFIALHKKYEKEAKKDSAANLKFDVINTSGKVLFSISMNKYKDFGGGFQNGCLDVYLEAKNEKCGGIINDKGEVVIKPTSKIKKVGQIRNSYFTYNNGDGWGVMNFKGETVIRAKYDILYFASDEIMVAMTKKDGGSQEFKYINMKDEMIGSDTYDDAYPFYMLDGSHAIVKVSSSMFSIVDLSGKQVEKLPDMVHVGFSEGDMFVESDYVDMKKLVSSFNISEEGVDGLSFKSTPLQVVKYYATMDACWRGDKDHSSTDPYWYTGVDYLRYWKDIMGVMPDIYVNFSGDIAKRNYRSKRVIDYTYGDWYWYHDEKIPTGISYTNAGIKSFKIQFDNSGKLRLKLRDVFNELASRFKNMGKVEKENNGAVVVTLKNGKRALVAMEKDNVFALWGDIKQVKDMNIDEYKDVKEESKRIKDYDFFENKLSGIAEADSLVVDTAAIE
ncbi:MAG: WG repeat-containing protein [Prevotella sp.]|nr:WG repeat-containing protein [Prevotella sp.]